MADSFEAPRRIRLDRMTPAELAITNAIQAVEGADAHPLLTDAVVLLGQARDRVADFVDAKPAPPVDRDAVQTIGGMPLKQALEIESATGMQKDYAVLTDEERAKGFVRPVRRSYVHEKCGSVTTMNLALAETYARDPGFYSGTFCVHCRSHFPVGSEGEFVWNGTKEKVGT